MTLYENVDGFSFRIIESLIYERIPHAELRVREQEDGELRGLERLPVRRDELSGGRQVRPDTGEMQR